MRIAPPEAPVNGYVYGKGLYFANSFNTSDGYSYNHNSKNIIILINLFFKIIIIFTIYNKK